MARTAARSKAVYFVQADASGLIKIGFTADSDERIRKLRGENGSTLTVLAIVRPADKPTEQALHERFAASCHHGEWFNPTPDLLDLIEQVKTGLRQTPKGKRRVWPAPSREPYQVPAPIGPADDPNRPRVVVDQTAPPGSLVPLLDLLLTLGARKLAREADAAKQPPPEPLTAPELKRVAGLLRRARQAVEHSPPQEGVG